MATDQDIPVKYAAALQSARARLTVADEVGLALRAHRRELGLSQRAYAAVRGLSRAMLARLEAGADRMSLATITEALDGTGFQLFVGHDDGDEPPPAASAAVAQLRSASAPEPGSPVPPPTEWDATDLLARVRGDSRRFPAQREVQAVDSPPLWWWIHEFFSGPTEEPQWYAPVCHLDVRRNSRHDADDDFSGAA